VDNDGDKDIIAGNEGLNSFFVSEIFLDPDNKLSFFGSPSQVFFIIIKQISS